MASPIIQFKRGDFANLPALQAGEPALTLDTFEFYIGVNSTTEENKFFGSHRYWTRETASTGSGVNLVESTGIGSDYITLSSPASLAGIVTYTFPAAPEDGYFLQTDADGNLSWTSVSAGASFSGAYLENTTLSGVSTFSGAIDANAGAANAAAADGAGLTVDGANATFTYASTGDKWVSNKDLEASNFNSTSDRNLKENIRTVENASELVGKLEGVHFTWKENGNASVGVIAQQIEEHLPELVYNGEEYKSVNYNGLVGVLIEAVKEQGAQIAALKAEIEELKK